MAQEASTIARPYAEAVFDRARETGSLDQWSDMLAFVAAIMQDDTLKAVVNNPNMTDAQITALVLDIAGERVSGEGANLVRLLVENDRLGIVAQIAQQFEELKMRLGMDATYG